MQTKNQKGFTIVELIVVIAIIAVLATIVLVNVTQYISKGRDASIKGNMNTILTNAAVHWDTNSSFTTPAFLTSATYTGPVSAIEDADGTVTQGFRSSGSSWCMYVTLTDGATTYCIDGTGFKGERAASTCTSSSYVCN